MSPTNTLQCNQRQAEQFITSGRQVVKIEQNAIKALAQKISSNFAEACRLLYNCKGKIVVIGMGKSGHIGKKIAATLASTGSPAFFVHPGEASHGDLGMISAIDVVLALSNSGEAREVTCILPLFKRLKVPLVSMTGNPNSTLSQFADVNLDTSVEKEACPMNLAPTASTTVSLVMGDALAVALLQAKGFSESDFALSHPGGSLGRKLLLKVSDIMHKGKQVPIVGQNTSINQSILEMSNKRLGMTGIVNSTGKLSGIFTDGDLRRAFSLDIDFKSTPVNKVMTPNCKTIGPRQLAAEALQVMEENAVNALIVTDEERRPIGALNMHDILRAGIA